MTRFHSALTCIVALCGAMPLATAFAPCHHSRTFFPTERAISFSIRDSSRKPCGGSLEPLHVSPESIDYEVVGLVLGQETYGFAIVSLGEAIWSFLEAPSLSHAKILIPAVLAALVLFFVSGPMVTSGVASSVAFGLEIATGVSVLLGASYVARLLAPYSPSPKEIVFLGLLVSVAGFFTFSQNLLVDGFVNLPSIPLPSLPFFELPSIQLPELELPSNMELPPLEPTKSLEVVSSDVMPSAASSTVEVPAVEIL